MISWTKSQVQFRVNPVLLLLYTGDASIETSGLSKSWSDNTRITNSIKKARGIRNTDHIAVPTFSMYGDETKTSTEVLLGIGYLNNT